MIPLLLILTIITTADAQLPGNTTRTKKFQCLRVRNLTDQKHAVLRGNQSEILCAVDRPTWPTDLTLFFVHWECHPLVDGVRTEPQFVFKLMITERNSTITWTKLRDYCGCKLTYYSVPYLSKETSSHNKWHFSNTTIPVGVSCDKRDTVPCSMTLQYVKKEWS